MLPQLKAVKSQLVYWVDTVIQQESLDVMNIMDGMTATDAMEKMKRDQVTLGNLKELKQFFINL